MMQFVIDTGNGNISDSSEEFDKKIELLEVHSFLVDVICKYHLRMEIPFYDKKNK